MGTFVWLSVVSTKLLKEMGDSSWSCRDLICALCW
jgi:hypothetical protein